MMKTILKYLLRAFLAGCFLVACTGGILWYIWSSNLPYIGSLQEYNPPVITEVFSDDEQVVGRFWNEKRIVVSLDQVPEHLIQAFVAAEDARFFEHEGIDIKSILRAFLANLFAGKIEQGGSTITQQVTRSLLLKDARKTYKRKAREALLSLQIEKAFTKEKILYLYINQIYLGHGAYGVEAASRTYFGKPAHELSLAESALMAGLPQAPSRYSPINHFDRIKVRQRYVLERMYENGYITQVQMLDALDREIVISNDEENYFARAPYFSEHVRIYLEREYGRDLLYGGGLKVYTSMNLEMQRHAQAALRKGLEELDKREGYRGPLRVLQEQELDGFRQQSTESMMTVPLKAGDIVEGLVEDVDDIRQEVKVAVGDKTGLLPLSEMNWARRPDPDVPYYSSLLKKPSQALKRGDVVLVRLKEEVDPSQYGWLLSLEQEPLIQGALLAIESGTGKVKAMVGGLDFSASQFNRAIQAKRQPGSAFKPLIYSAALDQGMTPATIILDSPYISTLHPAEDEDVWRPKNYGEKFLGPTLFRNALIESMNVITVKILRKIGVGNVIEYSRKMGIQSDLSPDLSLALGSSGLSLMEITNAYSVFSNNGMLVDPVFIDRIEDRTGRILEESQTVIQEAIPADTAFIMTDILKGVIMEGTGWRAKALNRPAAGKTGTTNDLRDALFIGFTPELLAGVWVGYDDRRPMGNGETGSRAASPIWLYFMSEALKDKPISDFIVPEGIVFARIDAKTGLLASTYSEKAVFQSFKKGTEPTDYNPDPDVKNPFMDIGMEDFE